MRALWLLAFAAVTGCAVAAPGGDDDDLDGELAAGDPDSAEDALSTQAITAYTAIAPPQHRLTTAAVPARVGPGLAAGRSVALLRTATFQGESTRLVIDEQTFATSLVPAAALEHASQPADGAATPWTRSLADVARRGVALDHLSAEALGLGADEAFALTIDMCQSRKPWEKRLFDWAVALSDQLRAPVPMGIAMTGVWAKTHPTELDQLLAWERSGKLAITWINHSSTHPLHCLDASCRKAEFLTSAAVDFDEEVLGEERAVLARGMAPSALFRFPGLVHDPHRLAQLSRLSMMGLGADGWIAKGQPIERGAVVLVHGNGNEPEGIVGFLKQVQTPARSAALASGKSKLVSPLLVAPAIPR